MNPAANTDSNASTFSIATSTNAPTSGGTFVDRRQNPQVAKRGERRQFGSTYPDLSDDGRELALAIDRYKMENHRRYLTCDELLNVIRQLGYERDADSSK